MVVFAKTILLTAPSGDPAAQSQIEVLLRSLYGNTVGRQTAARIAELITGRHSSMISAKVVPAFSESDALLIAYADQIVGEGPTPLRTLAAFCEKHLVGVVSGVHVLPFYPWSSDDGFSVTRISS